MDYGDVIYHIPAKVCDFSGNLVLPNLMEKLESVQYSAALAVTGTWRGTSREKLYTDLGWESLSSRRWSRRLTLFYEFVNDLSPEYTVDPISLRLRDQDVIWRLRARTEKFKSSFYPNCLSEWNKLEPELRHAPSVTVFKKTFLSIIRPLPNQCLEFKIQKDYLIQLNSGLVSVNTIFTNVTQFSQFYSIFTFEVNPPKKLSQPQKETPKGRFHACVTLYSTF